MNKERLLELADHIEKTEEIIKGVKYKFDMSTYRYEFRNDCGTRACIAGWAVALFSNDNIDVINVGVTAKELLDLSLQQSSDLFRETEHYTLNRLVSSSEAASVIRKFVETGEIIWPDRNKNSFAGHHKFRNFETNEEYGSFEVFYIGELEANHLDIEFDKPGWYWRSCYPGCSPDGEPTGPFLEAQGAYLDAMDD